MELVISLRQKRKPRAISPALTQSIQRFSEASKKCAATTRDLNGTARVLQINKCVSEMLRTSPLDRSRSN